MPWGPPFKKHETVHLKKVCPLIKCLQRKHEISLKYKWKLLSWQQLKLLISKWRYYDCQRIFSCQKTPPCLVSVQWSYRIKIRGLKNVGGTEPFTLGTAGRQQAVTENCLRLALPCCWTVQDGLRCVELCEVIALRLMLEETRRCLCCRVARNNKPHISVSFLSSRDKVCVKDVGPGRVATKGEINTLTTGWGECLSKCLFFFYNHHSLCPLCVAGRETLPLPRRSGQITNCSVTFSLRVSVGATSRIQSFWMTFSVA